MQPFGQRPNASHAFLDAIDNFVLEMHAFQTVATVVWKSYHQLSDHAILVVGTMWTDTYQLWLVRHAIRRSLLLVTGNSTENYE